MVGNEGLGGELVAIAALKLFAAKTAMGIAGNWIGKRGEGQAGAEADFLALDGCLCQM